MLVQRSDGERLPSLSVISLAPNRLFYGVRVGFGEFRQSVLREYFYLIVFQIWGVSPFFLLQKNYQTVCGCESKRSRGAVFV